MAKIDIALSVLLFVRLVQANPMLGRAVHYNNNTATITSSASLPRQTCCEIWAGFVALHLWYNSSYVLTDKTIITEYLQYNNTIVTATTTQHASSPIQYGSFPADGDWLPSFSGIPTNLIDYDPGDYAATEVQTETFFSNNITSIASPTPFLEFGTLYVFWGSSATSGQCVLPQNTYLAPVTEGSTTIDFPPVDFDPDFSEETVFLSAYAGDLLAQGDGIPEEPYTVSLRVPHAYYEAQEVQNNGIGSHTEADLGGIPLPQGLIDWLTQDPYFASQYPGIGLCVAGNGTGSPIVHIPVTQLTAESSTTIHMAGALTSAGIPTPISSHAQCSQ